MTIENTIYRFSLYLHYHAHSYVITDEETEAYERRDDMDYEMDVVNQNQVEHLPYWIYPAHELYGRSQLNWDNMNQQFYIDFYYIPETGTYTMDSPEDTGNEATTVHSYVIRGMTREDGTPIDDENGFQFNSGKMYVEDEEGNRIKVWCIEPEVLTWDGSKYEISSDVPENVRAAIATIYGSGITDLDKAIIESYVWSTVGYQVSFDQMAKFKSYDADTGIYEIEELSEAEKAYVSAVVARIDDAAAAYETGATADFYSLTDGVVVKDNSLVIYGDIPETIILEAGNAKVLSYYNMEGELTFGDGITGTVDLDKNQLILTIDTGVVKAGRALTMSLIPKDFPTETSIFESGRYVRQKLANFGIADHKYEYLDLVFEEMPQEDEKEPEDSQEEKKSTDQTGSEKVNESDEMTVKTMAVKGNPQTGDDVQVFKYMFMTVAGCILLIAGLVGLLKKYRSL